MIGHLALYQMRGLFLKQASPVLGALESLLLPFQENLAAHVLEMYDHFGCFETNTLDLADDLRHTGSKIH